MYSIFYKWIYEFCFFFSLSLAFHLNAIQEPQDLATANLIINELRSKCRLQAEQILAWKKAYTYEVRIRLMLQ